MSNNNFSDRLVSVENTTPAFREKYEREVKAMFERQKIPVERYLQWIFGILCLAAVPVFLYFYFVVSSNQPENHSVWMNIALWFLIVGTTNLINARKDTINVHIQAVKLMMFIGAAFLGAAFVLLFFVFRQHPGTVAYVGMVIFGLILLVINSAVNMLEIMLRVVSEMNMNMKEKLLVSELRLAELTEKPDQKAE
jgi:hypothetical protein